MKIDIFFKTKKYSVSKKEITELVAFVFRKEAKKDCAVSITFVTNCYIRKLNKKYKKRDEYTDVLAFEFNDILFDETFVKKELIGEIVISLDQAAIHARRFNNAFKKEVFLYVIHGILHILGYDDMTAKEKARMEARQNNLLNAFLKTKKE